MDFLLLLPVMHIQEISVRTFYLYCRGILLLQHVMHIKEISEVHYSVYFNNHLWYKVTLKVNRYPLTQLFKKIVLHLLKSSLL